MRDREKPTLQKARALRKAMPRAEVILWSRLRRQQLGGYRFRRQVPVGPCIADFACLELKLIVEVDGATHSSADEIAYDRRRTAFLEREGWHVWRVWNIEIDENLDGVLEGLLITIRNMEGLR
ncbi:endonuclease domain-containing protein [Hyphomonas sp.]|uniref:endonuclease domain-containing protein n=1 Tax=Hyphomonas sp. TaxID=87 RepID=UPI00391B4D53